MYLPNRLPIYLPTYLPMIGVDQRTSVVRSNCSVHCAAALFGRLFRASHRNVGVVIFVVCKRRYCRRRQRRKNWFQIDSNFVEDNNVKVLNKFPGLSGYGMET